MKLPLNGTRTHPLSEHAKGVLRELAEGSIRSHLINPGVRDRFERENLAVENELNGKRFYSITAAGRARLIAEGKIEP